MKKGYHFKFKTPASRLRIVRAAFVGILFTAIVSEDVRGAVSRPTDGEITQSTKGRFHVVKKGDTLNGLSRRYGISVDELKRVNHLKSDLIVTGRRLRLSPGSAVPDSIADAAGSRRVHVVRRGDTLIRIAQSRRVGVKELQRWNDLKSTVIYPGQRLRFGIPGETVEGNTTSEGKAASPDSDRIRTQGMESGSWGSLDLAGRIRLQIFLDEALFTPGKIDGEIGTFTERAIKRWGCSEGLTGEASRRRLFAIAGDPDTPAFQLWTVRDSDRNYVGAVAGTLSGKTKQRRLPYRSMAELVAERFHTDVDSLGRWNPGLNLAGLKPGDRLKVPAVKPFKIEAPLPGSLGGGGNRTTDTIAIVWPKRILEVRNAAGRLKASFPVTLGGKSEHVRAGTWEIGNYAKNPPFLWDDAMLKNGKRGEIQYLLPPGPNNPVGIIWMGLRPADTKRNAHIGIHGTNNPDTIGRAYSSGCIRLANWDVVRLAKHVRIGTRVKWVGAELSASSR